MVVQAWCPIIAPCYYQILLTLLLAASFLAFLLMEHLASETCGPVVAATPSAVHRFCEPSPPAIGGLPTCRKIVKLDADSGRISQTCLSMARLSGGGVAWT
jgi:hypothetical protein